LAYLNLVSDLFFAQSDSRILDVYFMKTANILVYGYITVYGEIFFLITKILDLAYVQNYMRCLSQNKSDTKLLSDLYIDRTYFVSDLYIDRTSS